VVNNLTKDFTTQTTPLTPQTQTPKQGLVEDLTWSGGGFNMDGLVEDLTWSGGGFKIVNGISMLSY
jgi:hypothetical protein